LFCLVLKPLLVTEFVISGYLQILVLSVGFFISRCFLFLVSVGYTMCSFSQLYLKHIWVLT